MDNLQWKDVTKECPETGRAIWIWDNELRNKHFARFQGDKDLWLAAKDNPRFPLWAYVWESENA